MSQVLVQKDANLYKPQDDEMTVWPFEVAGATQTSFHYKRVLRGVPSESQGLGQTQESILIAIQDFLEAGGEKVLLDEDLSKDFCEAVKKKHPGLV